MPKKLLHIIAHTHWDREWYLTYQQFRLKLIDLIDNLIMLLEEDKDFKCFHLDGQTVILEDYLELRPEKRDVLKNYIEQGRILVGPWYVLCDEFLVSGESIIRNLLLGHQQAQKMGKVMKIGYVVDAFGHISQLPQIFNNFEIDTAILWRGIGGDEIPSELVWKSPDGSAVLLYKLPDAGGYCYGVALPKNEHQLKSRLLEIIEERSAKSSANHLLLMNGCDHVEAQRDLNYIIHAANLIQDEAEVVQNSLPDFFNLLKSEIKKPTTISGELRDNRAVNLLPGTLSTRMYLKKRNKRCERLLEKYAEPLATIAWSLNGNFPTAQLWQAWKYLLQNQPHDSICGCSVDAVHRQMLTRFDWAEEIALELIDRSLFGIFNCPDYEQLSSAQAFLLVFNPMNWKRTEVLNAAVDFPEATELFYIEIYDDENVLIPCQVTNIELTEKLKTQPNGEPKPITVRQVSFTFIAENIPSCGYKIFSVKPATEMGEYSTDLKIGTRFIENDYLKIEIKDNGTFDVFDKKMKSSFYNCNLFEDGADVGDEYTYSYPLKDQLITGFSDQPEIALIEQGFVKATFEIKGNMYLPAEITHSRQSRSENRVKCRVVSQISLSAKTNHVFIKTEIDNRAKDHRLRVLFPTKMNSQKSHAGGHFDIIEREIEVPSKAGWIEDPMPTHPFQHFVSINDSSHGLTVASPDLTEYEVKNGASSIIALTLLRCVGSLARYDLLTRKDRDGWRFKTPEAQCLGKHEFSYALIPHAGNWLTSNSFKTAYNISSQPLVKQIDGPTNQLPQKGAFVSVSPDTVILSSIKKCEQSESIILRFFTVSNHDEMARVHFFQKISSAREITMAEEPVPNGEMMIENNHSVSFNIPRNKIFSLEIFFSQDKSQITTFKKLTYKIINMK